MLIKFYRKNVYGNELFYLDGSLSNQALEVETINRLIGQKTISKNQMELLNNLGFAFEEEILPVSTS